MSRLTWLGHALVLTCALTSSIAFAKDEPCEPQLAFASVPASVSERLSPFAKSAAIQAFQDSLRSVVRYTQGARIRFGETRAGGLYAFTVTVSFTYAKDGGALHSQDFAIEVREDGATALLETRPIQHAPITAKLPVDQIEEMAMQYIDDNQLGTLTHIHVLPMNGSNDLPKDYRVRMTVQKPNGFGTEIIKIGRVHAGGSITIRDL